MKRSNYSAMARPTALALALLAAAATLPAYAQSTCDMTDGVFINENSLGSGAVGARRTAGGENRKITHVAGGHYSPGRPIRRVAGVPPAARCL